ncbi:MAG: hypothetical protein ACRDKI_08065 [Solirubrobacterales bacterium]
MAETSISAEPIEAPAAINGRVGEAPESNDPFSDEAMLRAERIAFLSLASDLARDRNVLVVDDGASALAGIAAHLDSLPAAELADAESGAYELVVADLMAADAASVNGAAQLARITESENGLALMRVPNTDDFKPLIATIASSFANHRTIRQHNWVASALFDDAAFAWDNPSQAAVASLRKLAGAQPGEELYTLVLAGHGELPATVPHLAVTRSAVLKDLVADLQAERDRAAAEIAELKAEREAQADRIRELDSQLAWFDENELNLREAIEKRGWATALLNFWARSVSIAKRAKGALGG